MFFCNQKNQKFRGSESRTHNGLAGAQPFKSTVIVKTVVFVNKNPLPLFRRLYGQTYCPWKTKIPCQQRKLIQGILRKPVADFYLHWSLARKVSYVTIYTHKFTVGLYFLMNGGKTVCISFLCGQTVFSPLSDTRVWNKDDGKETKNIIQQS